MPKGETHKLSQETEREIIRLYTTKTSNGWMGNFEISKIVGTSPQTVINVLRRNGVNIRSASESHAGKACRPVKNLPVGNAPLCKCGCGRLAEWNQRKNRWNVFVEGHYRKDAPYKHPDWLKGAYKNQTVKQIAEPLGVLPSTISKFMEKFGIKRRKQSESLRMSGSVRGKRNPAWKGGVADWDYSHDWKSLCKQIKDRDKWTCQGCGERRKHWGIHLHVHHKDGNKLNNSLSNLVSLCGKCHREVHAGKRTI